MTASPALRPTPEQRRASAVEASVWVDASAGTGKTKVLTDRVLALMLSGTRADAILCLTFTKTAAAEMTNRILHVLGRWSTMDDAALAPEIADLLADTPDARLLRRAKRLFAAVLDLPGGLRVQTIHGFCDALLRRFPIEAGLVPHFEVLDGRTADEIMTAAQHALIGEARTEADGPLAAALAVVTGYAAEDGFDALMKALAGDRRRLKRILETYRGPDGAGAALRDRLGLGAGEDADTIVAGACADGAFDGAALRAAVRHIESGAKTDKARAERMAPWLAEPARRIALFDEYCGAFLTEERPRKELITKKLGGEDSPAGRALRAEANRLAGVRARQRAALLAERTVALLRVGAAVLARYEAHKARRAVLDFDDLVLGARRLLERTGAAAWVLYKLDGGIDHILIDEAQDTNPDQWAVVRAIAEEFFAGEGARAARRTIFAVGDAKQSIFSFQRADPDSFATMRDHFAARVAEAGRRWDNVDLTVSYRSTPAVLAVVDAVFAAGEAAAPGVAAPGETIRHRAERMNAPGLVELWPLVRPADAPPREAWAPPVVYRAADDPEARLAAVIAARVRRWIDTGEPLESAGRPIRAGDVMVLVRQRTDFMSKLVDAFKAARVPVAGVDRMKLTDQLAVQDLMALGRFALLPEDDLTLAVVLKGPLVGFDDDTLFALAWNRGERSLWATLVARAGETPGFAAAHALLADILAGADYVTPFAFYADILGRRRGREKILARLGLEAVDPIAEFLALALDYERSNPPSLQGFLHWVEIGEAEIKRELEQAGRDEVRVITVHGAKGLEAPIVFLPDTVSKPQLRESLFWHDGGSEDGPRLLLWSSAARLDDPVAAAARATAKERMEREYHRLLYVALTRARDRLYLCGAVGRRAPPEGCWHDLVAPAMARLGDRIAFDFRADDAERGWTGEGIRYEARPTGAPSRSEPAPAPAMDVPPLPDWAFRPAPADGAPVRPRAPSRAGEDETPLRAPVGDDHGALYRRGTLIHRLLQILPALPADRRAAAAAHFLARKVHRLAPAAQAAYAAETLAVLADARFAAVFGEGSAAEVPIVGTIEGVPFAGQIDRMLVGESEILVVDYKTNRPPPVELARVPRPYLRQLAAYRALVMRVYPGRSVSCAILWTDAPRLMPIPAAALDGLLP